jgi:hypothetical protein
MNEQNPMSPSASPRHLARSFLDAARDEDMRWVEDVACQWSTEEFADDIAGYLGKLPSVTKGSHQLLGIQIGLQSRLQLGIEIATRQQADAPEVDPRLVAICIHLMSVVDQITAGLPWESAPVQDAIAVGRFEAMYSASIDASGDAPY